MSVQYVYSYKQVEFFTNVAVVPTFQLCLDLRESKYFIGGPYISEK